MALGRDFVWHVRRFVFARHCVLLDLDDAHALFCERRQKLHRLNDAAYFIWAALQSGASGADAVDALCGQGLSSDMARAFVEQAVLDWLKRGFLRPLDLPASGEVTSLWCRLPVGAVRLILRGPCDHALIVSQLNGFANCPSEDAVARFEVIVGNDAALFLRNDEPVGLYACNEISPQIKSMLAEEVAGRLQGGFLAHGAFLSKGDHRLLLNAPPGTGKTTLALALSLQGFRYGGDDIIYVSAEGLAQGLCFSAAVKPSGWPLLEGRVPGLQSAPIHTRGDKRRVRYVLPPLLESGGLAAINTVIRLERHKGAKAHAAPLSPLEALCAVLESGWSGEHRASRTLMLGLAQTLARGRHHTLVYDDLDEAVAVVRDLVR
ncbi:MAG: hypothetical protein K2X34_02655 [Hyphomonadaceae bacterium]|nr:hypothetical protein [Hyphomonadaceae bacterium]MBY0565259.1 hypothetical protein [Hyphomonadaceae bacterium]